MAYQALLYCPDEKIAATVTQVLSELGFVVVPSADPFGAVKRMMGDRFDAVVVDCDNEQNAALLFKSARGSSENQNALAVAVVEGQAGVAKAFRLGANLVLTKPVNVEQAKGTLRVARGLLKKNEAARSAVANANASSSVTPSPASAPAKPSPFKPIAPSMPASHEEGGERASAKPMLVPPVATPPVAKKAATLSAAKAAASAGWGVGSPSASGSAAGVAPAPIKKIELDPEEILETPESASAATAKIALPVEDEPIIETSTETPAEAAETTASIAVKASAEAAAPLPYKFTFGGSNTEEVKDKAASGGSKTAIGAIAAMLALAAVGYFGWSAMHGASLPFTHKDQPAANEQAAPVKPAVTTPAPVAVVPAATSTTSSTSDVKSSKDASDPAAESETESSKSSVKNAGKSAGKESAPAPTPIVMGHSSVKAQKKADSDAAATPAMVAMSTTGTGMPALSSGQPGLLPKPVLDSLKVSQGVSLGLLVKKVQPVYPPNALRARIEGDVSLAVTVSKTGDITAIKVTNGSGMLAQSASDAVKQWKYKPYLLNGEPVEIQTDITVKFRLPH